MRLPFDAPLTPETVEVRLLDDRFAVAVQAATLYDERTGMFTALLPSDRGRFAACTAATSRSMPTKSCWPRAYVVTQTRQRTDLNKPPPCCREQLADSAQRAPLDGGRRVGCAAGQQRRGHFVSADRQPTRRNVSRCAPAAKRPGVLVLADAFYPGWRASVDGQAAAIYPANVLFRGVPVPAGEHTVVFTFEPSGWRLGLAVAGLGILLMAVLGLLAWWGFRRRRDHAV